MAAHYEVIRLTRSGRGRAIPSRLPPMYEAAARKSAHRRAFPHAPPLNGRFGVVARAGVRHLREGRALPPRESGGDGAEVAAAVAIEGLPPRQFRGGGGLDESRSSRRGPVHVRRAHVRRGERHRGRPRASSGDEADDAHRRAAVHRPFRHRRRWKANGTARKYASKTSPRAAPASRRTRRCRHLGSGLLTFAVRAAETSRSTRPWPGRSMKAVNPSMYRSGLIIDEKPELLRLAIGIFANPAWHPRYALARAETESDSRPRPSARAVASATRCPAFPTEQYLLIQCVREELRLNPEEAMHWYRRARLTIADPATRTPPPPSPTTRRAGGVGVPRPVDRPVDHRADVSAALGAEDVESGSFGRACKLTVVSRERHVPGRVLRERPKQLRDEWHLMFSTAQQNARQLAPECCLSSRTNLRPQEPSTVFWIAIRLRACFQRDAYAPRVLCTLRKAADSIWTCSISSQPTSGSGAPRTIRKTTRVKIGDQRRHVPLQDIQGCRA